MSRILLLLSTLLALTFPATAAWGQVISAEAVLKEAPAESRAQIAPNSKAHKALVSLLSSGHLNSSHIAKIVKNPLLSSRIGAVLPDLQKVQSVLGADRLLKQLVKATNTNRAVGFSFEAHVVAKFGSQLQEISATVNGHEVDAVLKNGTLVEMKSLPADKAVSKIMVEKATNQLALRGVQGQKLMLVTNRPLSGSLMAIVKKGLGARVQVREAAKVGGKRIHRLPTARSGSIARARVRSLGPKRFSGKSRVRPGGLRSQKSSAKRVRGR